MSGWSSPQTEDEAPSNLTWTVGTVTQETPPYART
jgi:hypothetical protein